MYKVCAILGSGLIAFVLAKLNLSLQEIACVCTIWIMLCFMLKDTALKETK